MPKISTCVFGAVLLVLNACTLAPSYERPSAPVTSNWPAAAQASQSGTDDTLRSPAPDLGWRDFFHDARLQAVIALALENNRDLRVATLNVARVRALYAITRADLLPEIAADGSGTRERSSAEFSLDGVQRTTNTYSVGLTSAYELDLFGRVNSLRNEALEQYLASEEAQRSAQLSLIGAVANQYITERALAEQRNLARQTLESVTVAFDLNQRRFEAGNASELDVRTAETQVQTARADAATLTQAHGQALNALVLLVGSPLPETLPAPPLLAAHRLIEDLPAALPSDVLMRRPDILQAEHELKAANASIGAARAAFFPSIRLTAFGGASSADLDRLFEAGTRVWSVTPEITLPIFAGGRNRANLDAANLRKQIEVARYEKAIQSAFREVADELVARANVEELLGAQGARVKAEERRYALATQRYQRGVDSYVVLLTAQRDLYSAQQLLVQAQQAKLTNLINLYRALGGGWREHSVADLALAH